MVAGKIFEVLGCGGTEPLHLQNAKGPRRRRSGSVALVFISNPEWDFARGENDVD